MDHAAIPDPADGARSSDGTDRFDQVTKTYRGGANAR
jgi:hypothetical protein